MTDSDLIEITRVLGNLEGGMQKGFEGINQRLDTANGRLAKHDEAITDLQKKDNQDQGWKSAISWIGSVFTIISSGIVAIAAAYIGAGKL